MASGSTLQFTGLPINTQFGTFNGFAFAVVDGIPNQRLICDDYSHTTYMPSGPLIYSGSLLEGDDPLQYARFARTNDFQGAMSRYEIAAILLDGLEQTGPGQLLDLTADYQYALWHLFTPSVALPTPTSRTLLADASAEVMQRKAEDEAIYGRLRILTPEEPFAANQEFLQLLDAPPLAPVTGPALAAPVPEPSPAILIGLGLLLLVGSASARRFRRSQ